MSSEMPAENPLPTDFPDVEEKINSNDNQVKKGEAGSDKTESIAVMSKRQMKKLMKQKQWEEQRDLRRCDLNYVSYVADSNPVFNFNDYVYEQNLYINFMHSKKEN